MIRLQVTTFLFLLCFSAFSQNAFPGYADGRVYVKFSKAALKGISRENPKDIPLNRLENLAPLLGKYGITRINIPFYQASDDEHLPYILKLHFSKAKAVDELISDLQGTDGVEYAEKIPLAVSHATPNDFAMSSNSLHLTQINALQAWDVFSGNSNITVAIVDNAVMWTHADLVANTYTNTGEIPNNNIDDDGNGYIDDVNGWNVSDDNNNPEPTKLNMLHGTLMAGIAGARTDNNTGVASIGWNIKIIPVQCEPDTGNSFGISDGYEGIIYAAKTGARVINCSWGNSISPAISEQAVVNYAWNKGCIIIAAAGNNSSTSPHWPAAYNNVYAVAAVDGSDVKIGMSNYGSWVDICAPGFGIHSTIPYTTTPAYMTSTGTSMSAPIVSGLAALMLSKSPGMTRQDVLNCISSTAVNVSTLSGNASYSTGLGAGRIDAFAAMTCAASFSAMPPVANFFASERFICPNTPVTFYDSSVYMPTAWSWTFQGGTPATSTLSNPVVQYSTTGTFSAALAVTNPNGSHNLTKLSYITVAGPIALPLSEGFQATQFLPANWTTKNIYNDGVYWERANWTGGFGTSSACAIFDNFNYNVAGERDEMRTPKYDLSNAVSAKLVFDVAYARYDSYYSDTLQVKLSTDCGVSWSSIYSKGGSTLATAPDANSFFIPASNQWRRDTVDISSLAAGQGNVMISFVNRGAWGQPIYLDNINLYFPAPTLTAVYPGTICTGQTVNYTNTSAGSTSYTWNLAGSVSNGTNAVHTFTIPGTYTGSLTGINGTAVITKTLPLTVLPYPTLTVNQPTICSGNSATLNASGADSYSWQAGPTTHTLQVTPASTTVYSLTGINGGLCTAGTSATVTVHTSPTVSVQDQTVCPGGSATLVASGAPGYSWSTGATSATVVITPGSSSVYTVTGYNGNCADTQTVSVAHGPPLTLSINVSRLSTCPGESATLTASGASSYSWSTGNFTNPIVVSPGITSSYSIFGAVGSCTGSSAITLSVDPQPTLSINFSPSLPICSGTSVTITATGASGYLWSTGASGSVVVVAPLNNTSYSVTGNYGGCYSDTSIVIPISGTSLNVSLQASQVKICSGKSVTLTASGAGTFTWSNAATGNSIVISPLTTNVYSVSGLAGGCSGSAAITVTVMPAPVSVLTATDNACNSGCSGILDVQTSSGSPPYTYSVTGSTCSLTPCQNLCAGAYQVLTTDAQGCSGSGSVTIGNSQPLNGILTYTDNSCAGCTDGAIEVLASGGIPPFSYSWTPAVSTQSAASGLGEGCFTVQLTDAGSCVETYTACITLVTGLSGQEKQKGPWIFPNPAEFEINVVNSGKFDLRLFNHLGQLLYEAAGAENSARVDLRNYAKGIYFIEITDRSGIARKKILHE